MTKKLNEFYDEIKSISDTVAKAWIQELINKKFDIPGFTTQYDSNPYQGHFYPDTYKLVGFERITRDGILECQYRRITSNYGTNILNATLHKTNAMTIDSIDEIKNIVSEIETVTPDFINTSRETTNKFINKENKKIDRQNTVINAKSKFTQIRIYIDYAIIAIVLIMTLSTLFSNGIGGAIAMGIFLDSWVIYICVQKIKDHRLDLQLNDMNKKTNDLKKKKHV